MKMKTKLISIALSMVVCDLSVAQLVAGNSQRNANSEIVFSAGCLPISGTGSLLFDGNGAELQIEKLGYINPTREKAIFITIKNPKVTTEMPIEKVIVLSAKPNDPNAFTFDSGIGVSLALTIESTGEDELDKVLKVTLSVRGDETNLTSTQSSLCAAKRRAKK